MNTVSQKEYNKFKQESLDAEPVRKEILMSDINIISDEKVAINNLEIEMNPAAVSDLRDILGMPKKFTKQFGDLLGAEARQRLVNIVKGALVATGKSKSVTLVVSPKSRRILRILPENNILSAPRFFETFERLMNAGKFDVKDITRGPDGGLAISTVAPNHEFNVNGSPDEFFHPGFTFRNDFGGGTSFDSFLYRLVCSNGMVARGISETVNLTNDKDSFEKFFSRIEEIKMNKFVPMAFKDKAKLAINTPASLFEVKSAAEAIMHTSKAVTMENIDKFIPLNNMKWRFAKKGLDINKLNQNQERNTVTDSTVWEVVNGLTDFASHDYGFGVDRFKQLQLQTAAGNLLGKKSFDTQNLVTVSL